MKQTYRVVAGLIALGVLVQAAAVAFGWFEVINGGRGRAVVLDENYEGNAGQIVHGIVGSASSRLLGLILLGRVVLRGEDRPRRPQVGRDRLRLIVLQVALAIFAFAVPGIGALHGLNALLAARRRRPGRGARCGPVPAAAGGARHAAPAVRAARPRGRRSLSSPLLRRLRRRRSRWSSPSSLLAYLGWSWWSSLVPRTYSITEMGDVEYGGGPGGHDHGGTQVAELTGPTTGEPDVAVELAAAQGTIRLASGEEVEGYTLNGTSPGPTIEAQQGDLVQVTVTNEDVAEGITLHWHGVDVPNAEDGVAGVTQDAVRPAARTSTGSSSRTPARTGTTPTRCRTSRCAAACSASSSCIRPGEADRRRSTRSSPRCTTTAAAGRSSAAPG